MVPSTTSASVGVSKQITASIVEQFHGEPLKIFLGSIAVILGNVFGVAGGVLVVPTQPSHMLVIVSFMMALSIGSYATMARKSESIKSVRYVLTAFVTYLAGGFAGTVAVQLMTKFVFPGFDLP